MRERNRSSSVTWGTTDLVRGDKRVGCARPASTSYAAYAMDKELRSCREIVVDHMVELWDVEATRCDIGDQQCSRLVIPEAGQVELACCLVHGAVDGRCAHIRHSQ